MYVTGSFMFVTVTSSATVTITVPSGQCPHQSFEYSSKTTPTPGQIVEWIHERQAEGSLDMIAPRSQNRPLTPGESLVALMPKAAKDLLPRPLQDLSTHPELLSLYHGEECTTCPTLRKELSARHPSEMHTI